VRTRHARSWILTRPVERRGHLVAAASAAVLIFASSCSSAADEDQGAENQPQPPGAQQVRDDDRPPAFPRRTGERVLVETGGEGADAWEVHAQPSELGMCLQILVPERGRELSCDFEVPRLRQIGQMVFTDDRGGSSFQVVAGPVVDYAVTVRLQFARGEAVDVAPVEPMPRSEQDFYAVEVSGRGPVTAVVALDRAGRTIQRLTPATP